MITLILINILCILILVTYFMRAFYKYGRNLLMDITNLYYLVIIIFPLILFIVNELYLYFWHPEFVVIGLYPLFIPLSYFLAQYYDKHFSEKKYILLSQLKGEIVICTKKYDLNIKPNDIRLRMLPKNRVDVIVNTEPGYGHELLEDALSSYKDYLLSNKEYKKFIFNFYIDEKKNNFAVSFIT